MEFIFGEKIKWNDIFTFVRVILEIELDGSNFSLNKTKLLTIHKAGKLCFELQILVQAKKRRYTNYHKTILKFKHLTKNSVLNRQRQKNRQNKLSFLRDSSATLNITAFETK